MKNGRNLVDLAAELQRQAETKKDAIVPSRLLEMQPNGDLQIRMSSESPLGEIVPLAHTAHRQLGTRVGIPGTYYERMKAAAPELLAQNVNYWFQTAPEDHLVRMLDGQARAFLSNKYQRIDNYEVAEAVLPVLGELGVRVISAEVTERRLYLKAVNERSRKDVKVGDTVEAGVLITNSEIGFGALTVQPLVHRLVCLNGMVVNDTAFRRKHVGKALEVENDAALYLSDETVAQTDKAILMQARDIVRGALDEALFGRTVEKMQAAAGDRIEGSVTESVRVLGKTVGLLQHEAENVLATLIDHGAECGGSTRYGLLNAVTKYAQTVESYDRSTELEAIGGKILDLPSAEWRQIAQAA